MQSLIRMDGENLEFMLRDLAGRFTKKLAVTVQSAKLTVAEFICKYRGEIDAIQQSNDALAAQVAQLESLNESQAAQLQAFRAENLSRLAVKEKEAAHANGGAFGCMECVSVSKELYALQMIAQETKHTLGSSEAHKKCLAKSRELEERANELSAQVGSREEESRILLVRISQMQHDIEHLHTLLEAKDRDFQALVNCAEERARVAETDLAQEKNRAFSLDESLQKCIEEKETLQQHQQFLQNREAAAVQLLSDKLSYLEETKNLLQHEKARLEKDLLVAVENLENAMACLEKVKGERATDIATIKRLEEESLHSKRDDDDHSQPRLQKMHDQHTASEAVASTPEIVVRIELERLREVHARERRILELRIADLEDRLALQGSKKSK